MNCPTARLRPADSVKTATATNVTSGMTCRKDIFRRPAPSARLHAISLDRRLLLHHLVEGVSVRATMRLTGTTAIHP